MIQRKNCWEYMECGREPGGENTNQLGVCPASQDIRFDGINGGKYAGRFCWIVSGTLCNGEVQGSFAKKLGDCLECPFLREVEGQEGETMVFLLDDYFQHLEN